MPVLIRLDLMMVKSPVNQIPLSHDGLILTSDRASIAAVVSEAAVAITLIRVHLAREF
jgi:hypothetical protein